VKGETEGETGRGGRDPEGRGAAASRRGYDVDALRSTEFPWTSDTI
jgi:hypothetical protein